MRDCPLARRSESNDTGKKSSFVYGQEVHAFHTSQVTCTHRETAVIRYCLCQNNMCRPQIKDGRLLASARDIYSIEMLANSCLFTS